MVSKGHHPQMALIQVCRGKAGVRKRSGAALIQVSEIL